MLNSIFIILLFQLIGELIQKVFELSIPGPVIGLIFLLSVMLIIKKINKQDTGFETKLVNSAENLLTYLPLLFIPVGVGVVMHLSLLEENLVPVILVINSLFSIKDFSNATTLSHSSLLDLTLFHSSLE